MSETDGIPVAFREHFTQHNRQVVLLVSLTLAAAVLLWVTVYVLLYWVVLFVMTALQGGDAHIPKSFLPIFAGFGLLLCVTSWLLRKLRPTFFPSDHKNGFEIFMDILLALPRVTLEIWGNLSALRFLNEEELEAAWHLMQVVREHRKLSIHSIPLEIPDAGLRGRVLLALQLVGLVEVRKYGEELWLVLVGEKARDLTRQRVKIDTGRSL